MQTKENKKGQWATSLFMSVPSFKQPNCLSVGNARIRFYFFVQLFLKKKIQKCNRFATQPNQLFILILSSFSFIRKWIDISQTKVFRKKRWRFKNNFHMFLNSQLWAICSEKSFSMYSHLYNFFGTNQSFAISSPFHPIVCHEEK